jgi:hypothetical protein
VAQPQARSFEDVLVAIATNERVAAFLRIYPERDLAIEALEHDMDRQRRGLVADLRASMRERTGATVAHRLIRDDFITGLRQF